MNGKFLLRSMAASAVLACVAAVLSITAIFPQFDIAIPRTFSAYLVLTILHFVFILLGGLLVFWLMRNSAATVAQSTSKNRELGSIKWFDVSKGFGFITRDSGGDVFVHIRSFRDKKRRIFRDGQRVEFIITKSRRGPQADDVVTLDK